MDTQKGKVAEADVIVARLDEIDTRILNLRSKELFGNLFNKQKSLINPANLFEANKYMLSCIYDLAYSPINWYESLNASEKAKVYSNVLPAFIIFILSLILGVYLRLLIMRKFGYDNNVEHPRYGKKVSAAVCVAIGYGVIPSCIIVGMLIWIASSEILTGYFASVIGSFLFFSLYVLLGRAIARPDLQQKICKNGLLTASAGLPAKKYRDVNFCIVFRVNCYHKITLKSERYTQQRFINCAMHANRHMSHSSAA